MSEMNTVKAVDQSTVDQVMKKYDRESNTRVWTGKPKIVIDVILAAFSIW